jgi:hypothetical protein
MAGIMAYLLLLTLSVNGLNSPIKRHCLANWIKKEDQTICFLQETLLLMETNTVLWLKVVRRLTKLMVSENRQE